MDWIDKLCIVFYYTAGPAVLLWLAGIAHTIFCFE
jgi:hypothetical protein